MIFNLKCGPKTMMDPCKIIHSGKPTGNFMSKLSIIILHHRTNSINTSMNPVQPLTPHLLTYRLIDCKIYMMCEGVDEIVFCYCTICLHAMQSIYRLSATNTVLDSSIGLWPSVQKKIALKIAKIKIISIL